jgi:hypothetical protein
MPDLSQPYKTNSKISQRPWFSREEYRQLYTLTQSWAKHPPIPRLSWGMPGSGTSSCSSAAYGPMRRLASNIGT